MTRVGRLEALSRVGFVARGTVYLLVGMFAVQAAWGAGAPKDRAGALESMLGEPFGQFLLALMALGFVGYSTFRVMEASLDLEGHGDDARGWIVRAGHFVSAGMHAVLAVYAAGLALGIARGGSGDSAQSWTAWLLAQPYGQVLVISVGLGIAGAGFAQLAKTWSASFMAHLTLGPRHETWVAPTGRVGFAARSVVFGLIGAFLIGAGLTADSSQAGGLADALRKIQEQSYGTWLLGTVACGLILFGLFSFIEAAYRRITDAKVLARLRNVSATG